MSTSALINYYWTVRISDIGRSTTELQKMAGDLKTLQWVRLECKSPREVWVNGTMRTANMVVDLQAT